MDNPNQPTAQQPAEQQAKSKKDFTFLFILLLILMLLTNIFLGSLLLSEDLQDQVGLNNVENNPQEENNTEEEEDEDTPTTDLDIILENSDLQPEEVEESPQANWQDLIFTTNISDFSNVVYEFTLRVPQGTTAQASTGIGFEYQTLTGTDFTMNFSSAYEGYTEGYLAYEVLDRHGLFGSVYRVESEPGVYKYTTDAQVATGVDCTSDPFPATAPCGSPIVSNNVDIAFRLTCNATTPEGIETCDLIFNSTSAEIVP